MKVPPWSHSLLSDFANCPEKACRKYVVRDLPKEDMTPERQWGIDVHKALEDRLNSGAHTELSRPYEHFVTSLVGPTLDNRPSAERKLGVTSGGGPASFFGDPWGRGVIDVLKVDGPNALILDWKTGKVREDPAELFTHAILVKAHFPEVKKITGAYVWLKENKLGKPYDLSNTERAWNAAVASMRTLKGYLETGYFPKTPNALCGWCPVKDCEHNRS